MDQEQIIQRRTALRLALAVLNWFITP